MRLSNARQASEVDELVLVLQILDQLVEFNLPGDEVSDLGTDSLEFDMVTSAVERTTFLGPARLTVLATMLVLASGDH